MCTEKLVNFMIIREFIERKTDWIFLSLLDRPLHWSLSRSRKCCMDGVKPENETSSDISMP